MTIDAVSGDVATVPSDDFEEFWRRMAPRLARHVRSRFGPADVDDVVQVTMLRSYEQWSCLDRSRDPWPWLMVVARNVATDRARDRTRREALETGHVVDLPEPVQPEEAACREETRAAVRAALARLRESDREVLHLRHHDGLPSAEIARRVGRSDGAVRQQLRRARKLLAREVRSIGEGRLPLSTPTWRLPFGSVAQRVAARAASLGAGPDNSALAVLAIASLLLTGAGTRAGEAGPAGRAVIPGHAPAQPPAAGGLPDLTSTSGVAAAVRGGAGWLGETACARYTGVGAGFSHALAVRDDGTVWIWGNTSGDHEQGAPWPVASRPHQVPGLAGVRTVAGGLLFSLAVDDGGAVWAWGRNDHGQLGDGTTAGRPAPARVPGLPAVRMVAAGQDYAVALASDGTVWSWGANGNGQLGDGTVTERHAPVRVPGLSDVRMIAAALTSLGHTVAVTRDGTAWAWGDNSSGQLGDGTVTERDAPVRVAHLAGVRTVSAGWNYSLAVRDDGTVWAWGRNERGQLGDGTTAVRLTPGRVPGLSGVLAGVAGTPYAVAVGSGGLAYVWGHNVAYETAVGTAHHEASTGGMPATRVRGVARVVAAVVGGDEVVVLQADGAVRPLGFDATDGMFDPRFDAAAGYDDAFRILTCGRPQPSLATPGVCAVVGPANAVTVNGVPCTAIRAVPLFAGPGDDVRPPPRGPVAGLVPG